MASHSASFDRRPINSETASFGVPVLMYHEVTNEDRVNLLSKKIQHSFIITQQRFAEQMQWLHTEGFSTLSLYELLAILRREKSGAPLVRSVVLTFDDGFEGNYKYALPILQRYGFSATFFVIVNKVGTPFMMDWRQLREINEAGMYVQSHTMTHPLLGLLNSQKIMYELDESKRQLEDRLQSPVDFVSLPNGSYNELYKDIAAEVGYLGGCTSDIAIVQYNSDPFFLPRIVVNSKYNLDEFSQIAEGKHGFINKMLFKKRYKNIVKKFIGEHAYNRLYNFIFRIEE